MPGKENPADYRYSREHEWVRVEDETAVVGITDHAQEQLGDVVFVNLPEPGTEVKQFEKFGEVESVKAVSDLYAPISGEVVERNEKLVEHPELVNNDPYGEGWMIKVAMRDVAELNNLMSKEEYERMVGEQA